jgi:hypothetical protein
MGPRGANGCFVAAVAAAFTWASLADSPPDHAKAHEPPFVGSSSNVADGQVRLQISGGATGAISAVTANYSIPAAPDGPDGRLGPPSF